MNANTYDNDADWYPGDKYVDIIGRDLYGYDAAKQAHKENWLCVSKLF